jgi:signal transduction histidine kinase
MGIVTVGDCRDFEALLNLLPVGIGIAGDPQCKRIRANPTLAGWLGIALDANASLSTGESEQPVTSRVYRDGREIPAEELPMQVAAAEGRELRDVEVDLVRSDGTILRLLEYAAPLYDEQGQVRGSIGIMVDITRRKTLEAERERLLAEVRAESAEQLRALHEMDRAILGAQSPAEVAQIAVRSVRSVIGCSRSSVVLFEEEARAVQILAVESDGSSQVSAGACLPLDGYRELERRIEGRAGTPDDVQGIPSLEPLAAAVRAAGVHALRIVPLQAGGKQIGNLHLWANQSDTFTPQQLAYAAQVADSLAVAIVQARLSGQVSRDRQQLQGFTRRLVEAQEQERRYIAHELHDEAGQMLTSLQISLGLLERECQRTALHLAEPVQDIKRSVDDVQTGLHQLSRNLRPASLDTLGLVPALRQHVRSFAQQTGLSIEFVPVRLGPDRLPLEIETTLYRVVQEALTNVARHAGASRADVILKQRSNHIMAIIEDDGQGFDLQEGLASGRLGLLGMRERVEMLGGRFSIESRIGHGTTVFVDTPISPGGEGQSA